MRAVARAVVGQDAADADTCGRREVDRCRRERDDAGASLVRQDLREGQAAVVVDRDVHIVPPDPLGVAARTWPEDTLAASLADAPELLDVEVHHVTRFGPLVAPCRLD